MRSERTNTWYGILPVSPLLLLASIQQISLVMNLEVSASQRLGKIIFIARVQEEIQNWESPPGLQIPVTRYCWQPHHIIFLINQPNSPLNNISEGFCSVLSFKRLLQSHTEVEIADFQGIFFSVCKKKKQMSYNPSEHSLPFRNQPLNSCCRNTGNQLSGKYCKLEQWHLYVSWQKHCWTQSHQKASPCVQPFAEQLTDAAVSLDAPKRRMSVWQQFWLLLWYQSSALTDPKQLWPSKESRFLHAFRHSLY